MTLKASERLTVYRLKYLYTERRLIYFIVSERRTTCYENACF